MFFARKVVLVEGPEDRIACKLALERMAVQLDRLDVSVIDCGGITGIGPLAKILKGFDIEVLALIDEDPGNSTTEKQTEAIESVIGKEHVFKKTPQLEGLFGMQSLTKVKALRDLPDWYERNPLPEVYDSVKNAIS